MFSDEALSPACDQSPNLTDNVTLGTFSHLMKTQLKVQVVIWDCVPSTALLITNGLLKV